MAITRQKFAANLIDSRLMTAADLDEFLDGLAPSERARDAQSLANELIRAGKLTKYQAEALCRGKTRRLVLGEYVVLDPIGAGGMGEVFAAKHRIMDRVVAIKVLSARAVNSAEAVERFRREVRTAAKLVHPNIVAAYDASQYKGIQYLVMEYVDGKDLSTIIRQHGPLSVNQSVDCMIQTARGLEYAHARGVIHRDIKPRNLLLNKEGTVKILDMGLARIREVGMRNERLTSSGEVLGTCDYMAPEQATDAHEADHRADVYSLGCTLHRVITGHRPFKANSPIKTLLAHREKPVPSLRALRPEIPPALDTVCQKMMAKGPDDRQQSMTELIDELEACKRPGEEPVSDGTPAPASQSDRDTALVSFLESIEPPSVSSQHTKRARARHKRATAQQETLVSQEEQETTVVPGQGVLPAVTGNKPVLAGAVAGALGILFIVALALVLTARDDPDRDEAGGGEVAQRAGQSKPKTASQPKPEADTTSVATRDPSVRDAQPVKLTQETKESTEKNTDQRVHSIQPPQPGETPAGPQVAKAPDRAKAPGAPARAVAMDPIVSGFRRLEARYALAVAPAEAMASAWGFRPAEAALAPIRFSQPELAARLAVRREEVRQMAALKRKIMAAINGADPPITKASLFIRGLNGDLTKADERGITATLRDGRTETYAWKDLGEKAIPRLLQVAIDQDQSGDWLAAGLIASAAGNGPLAEEFFNRAGSQGLDIHPYLGSLAAAAMAQATELLDQDKYSQSSALLDTIQEKYANIPWFAKNGQAFDAVRRQVQMGIHEEEAEELYKEAAERYSGGRLFDLRETVRKLLSDYGGSHCVTDVSREPSFAEMSSAVADLGERFTVVLDGSGDFTSIQKAIDAADRNSLIEIKDDGPYDEQLEIPLEKEGLIVRGDEGHWPVITCSKPGNTTAICEVHARRVTLQQLALVQSASSDQLGLSAVGDVFQLRSTIIFSSKPNARVLSIMVPSNVTGSVVIGSAGFVQQAQVADCLLVGRVNASGHCRYQGCTVTGPLRLGPDGADVQDSIIGTLQGNFAGAGFKIARCGLISGPVPEGSQQCFQADPQFRDPANLDYRLRDKSPCRGKASDGGDLGCPDTPELIGMCEITRELRQKATLAP